MKEGKYDQVDKCIKSRITTEVIDSVLSIHIFQQHCVVLKIILQSQRSKNHVQTIGIDQSLSNNAIFENKCLENIKTLHKQSGKSDNQQQLIDILEAAMVSTPEGFTNNIPISPMKSSPVKKPSAQKSLCMFTNVLEVNKKLITIELDLLNLSARQLNMEIHQNRKLKNQ